jgi:hypothetical protein
MSVCPNINLPEWQALEKAVGRFEAYKDFVESGYEIRSVEEVQEKIDKRREGITKAKVYPHTQGLMSGNLYEVEQALADSSQPNIENMAKRIANDSNVTRAMEIARKLSNSLGVNFDIINAERAQQITAGTKNPWTGQPAFYYGGQVYFVGETLSVNNVLHEFAHPLIRQIQVDNPALFQNLYNKLAATDEGVQIINNVKNNNPDLMQDGQMFQEEVMVKALEKAAVDQEQTSKFAAFIRDILFAIKKVLRNALGKIEVSSLDQNTTLDQLAYMLTNDQFQINTELITEEDVVAYVRDYQQEINDMARIDKVQLQALIKQAYDLAAGQLTELRNNENYKELALILRDQYKVPEMEVIMNDLRKYRSEIDKIVDDEVASMERLESQANALVSTVYNIDTVISKIQIHMDDIYKTGDSQSNMAKMHYYAKIVKYWGKYIQQLEEEFNKPGSGVSSSSKIYQVINNINTNLKKIENVADEMAADGARDTLYSELEPITRDVKARYEEIISGLKKKGAPQRAIDRWHKEYYGLTEDAYKRYSELREKLRNKQYMSNAEQLEYANMRIDAAKGLELTPEKIEDLLKGKIGDANWYSSYLEGYLSNPDPIVGGLALFVKNRMNEVMARAQAKFNDFSEDISQALKDYGYNPTNIGKLGRDTGFEDIVAVEEEGQLVQKKVWTFLNPFKDYRYDLKVMNKNLDEAEIEYSTTGTDESLAKLRNAVAEKKEFMRKYFHQEYKPEFYKRQELLERDEIGKIASHMRETIIEKIRKESKLGQNETEQLESTQNIDRLWREYRQLHSLFDLFGNKKTGQDLQIAERLREYRDQSREFYNWKERAGVFQSLLNKYEDELAARFSKDDPMYSTLRDEWIRKNTRVVIKPSFYTRRQEIFQKIKDILDTLPDSQKKEADLSVLHNAIIDIKAGFRDEDGQPNPAEMTKEAVEKVKRLEEELQERKKAYIGLNGLTGEDQARLSELYSIKATRDLTALEASELNTLYARKSTNQLDKYSKAALEEAYRELEEMSSTEATNYYTDIVNNYLQRMDTDFMQSRTGSRIITETNADGLLDDELITNLKSQDAEFARWFDANHVKTTDYKGDIKYKRVSVWSVVRPADSQYLEKTEIKDRSGRVIEVIDGLPTLKYYKQEVKEEYKTDLIIGKTIDNKGNFLPKALEDRDPGVDDKYINQEYYRIKNTNPQLFNILEKLKEHHLRNQQGLDAYSKLYLDFPRFTKGKFETIQSADLTQYVGRVREFFKGAKDDAESGFNYNNQSNMVKLDMFDDEVTKVPIAGLYNLDAKDVSTDIITSMMRYSLSAERQKQLIEISPLARAVQKVVNNPNNTVDLEKINKWNFVHRQLITYKKKKGTSVRASAVNNFLEREFEGQTQKGVASESAFINNFTNLLFKNASRQFFALNIPSALKNYYSAKWQTVIETSAGRYLNPISAGKGNAWAFAAMGEMSFTNQLYKKGPKSLNMQLIEIFDPSQGRSEQRYGSSMSRTIAKDVLEGSWLYSPRKWLELQATLQVFAGMMYHVNDIERKLPNGTVQKISYMDAWELRDNKIQLKEGVDPKWGITYDENGELKVGTEFNRFKNRMQQVMNNLNGAYAEFDQPEAQRYVAFRMVSFMRKYFTSMVMNRMGHKGPLWKASPRMNYGMGEQHMGFYVQTLMTIKNAALNADVTLKYATKEEKAAAMRMLTEIALLMLASYVIYALFGYDPDDDEKWDKLKNLSGPLPFPFVETDRDFNAMGYLKLHALNQVMSVRAENEQFLPLPGVGLDDYLNLTDLKSIALGPTTDTWTAAFEDLYAIVTNSDDAYYTRDVGPYSFQKKESPKLIAKLAKLAGFTGTSLDPAQGIKNFVGAQALARR